MQFFRHFASVIALTILCGLALLFFPFSASQRLAVSLLSGVLILFQGLRLWKTRPDRYDLNTLWEAPFPEEIQPDEMHPYDAQAYCPNCHSIVPEQFAKCPECGQRL
jgi:uncharacterized paraquat-inducible protein A